MLGNCATGRGAIVTAPTITIRIAITIATMGRLMKNLDIIRFLCVRASQRSLDITLKWLVSHGHSRPEVLLTFDNHAFTGIQSFLDDPHRITALSHLHGTHADAVVLIDDGNEIASLLLIYGGLGNQRGILLFPDHGADFAVLPGAQIVARIWKECGELNGSGVLIHLAIGEIELA